jgi:hypothetical protein
MLLEIKPFKKRLTLMKHVFIEYVEFEIMADMYVTEIVLANREKPVLNVDDHAKDELTIHVNLEPIWKKWTNPQWLKKWNKLVETQKQSSPSKKRQVTATPSPEDRT